MQSVYFARKVLNMELFIFIQKGLLITFVIEIIKKKAKKSASVFLMNPPQIDKEQSANA